MTSYLREAYSQTFDSPAFPMSLTIRSAVSGEVIAELQAEAFSDKPARLLKNALLPKIGYSRFCQRLLVDSSELSDDDVVTSSELQLVFVPFCETSPEDYWQLGRACRGGFVDELEELLVCHQAARGGPERPHRQPEPGQLPSIHSQNHLLQRLQNLLGTLNSPD